jgi:hypothetical protein
MIFKNRRFFTRQTIEIQKNSLKIYKKTIFDSIEHEISYEKLDNKRKIQTNVNNGLLVIAFFFIVLGIFFLVGSKGHSDGTLFLLALVFIIIAFVTRMKVITIASYDGSNIELYFNHRKFPDFQVGVCA